MALGPTGSAGGRVGVQVLRVQTYPLVLHLQSDAAVCEGDAGPGALRECLWRLWSGLSWRTSLTAGVRRWVAEWHSGAVSQGRGPTGGPLKPAVVSGTDLQSVPAKPPGCPSWTAFVRLASSGGRRPHRGSTKMSGEQSPLLASGRLARSEPAQRGCFPLTASERLRSNRGRIRAVSSDCLRSPLQPVLAGHSRFDHVSSRSE